MGYYLNRIKLMNYFKLSFAFCISLLLLSCNNQKQNKELSAERRLLDTFFMQAQYYNDNYPDETILLSPKDTNSNEYIERTFYFDLGVSDVSKDLKDTTLSQDRIRRLFEINNIENISCYMLYYNDECLNFDQFPTDYELHKNKIKISKLSPFQNISIVEKSRKSSFYSYCELNLDVDASLKNYDYQSKHFSSIKPVYSSPIKNFPNNDSNAIEALSPSETEGKFNDITPIKNTKRFVVKFHIPKVYSNNLIRFQSRTNRMFSLINPSPIISEKIIIDRTVFPKKFIYDYLNEVYNELSQYQLPDIKNLKNEKDIALSYFKFEERTKKLFFKLRNSNIKGRVLDKIYMYIRLSREYLLSEYPHLTLTWYDDPACHFNIRIAERR